MNDIGSIFVKLPMLYFLLLALSACSGGGSSDVRTDDANASLKSAPGAASVNWNPPLENTQGEALTDLAGYRIYYGTENGVFNNVITIEDIGITTYVIEDLPKDETFYFVVTAFDAKGVESDYSAVTSKTI